MGGRNFEGAMCPARWKRIIAWQERLVLTCLIPPLRAQLYIDGFSPWLRSTKARQEIWALF